MAVGSVVTILFTYQLAGPNDQYLCKYWHCHMTKGMNKFGCLAGTKFMKFLPVWQGEMSYNITKLASS